MGSECDAGALRVESFKGTPAVWDRAVGRFEGGTFAHLWGWRSILSEALGHESVYLVALNEADRIEGILPLARVKSRLFGDYLLSMPFLNYGGPLGTMLAQEDLVAAAVERARGSGSDLLELRTRRAPPGKLQITDRKITVLMDLPSTSEELWDDGLRSKLRSQIRRPMKEKMTASFGADLVGPFYKVFSRTMRDLGTPVLPRGFFEGLIEHLGDHVVFCVVEHQGRPAAAGCGFLWQGEFEITWAGAMRELNNLSPNMLLYWSLMEESIRRHAHTFNFGRCTPDSGTHRFKKQWPGRDVPLEWGQWSPTGLSGTPNPDSPKFRLAVSMWQRLPLRVANLIGPVLARSLP